MLLWGLSILCAIMIALAVLFGILPLIWVPIVLVLQLGMVNIFLCGYRGQEISAMQLFEGFGNGKFIRNAGGMGWRSLWLLIWLLVPVAGPILFYVKFYSYRFVPYIMLSEPDIHATEALKKSIAQTNGYKGKMFLVDLVVGAAIVVSMLVLILLAQIPFIGILFYLIAALLYIAIMALLPLFLGILEAVYYEKISKENPVD